MDFLYLQQLDRVPNGCEKVYLVTIKYFHLQPLWGFPEQELRCNNNICGLALVHALASILPQVSSASMHYSQIAADDLCNSPLDCSHLSVKLHQICTVHENSKSLSS